MPFPRPKKSLARPQPKAAPPAAAATGAVEEAPVSRSNVIGTLLALFGIMITAFTMEGAQPSSLARFAAIGVAISLGISVLADLRHGVRNVIRADVMALAAFYFLTLFEFLFPQELFDTIITMQTTHLALQTVLIGFAGLLIGRHLLRPKTHPFPNVFMREIPSSWLVTIFWVAFAIGYAHIFLAVNFNLVEMVEAMMAPRFSQPWGRGRLGDWKALLVELGMFIFLLPPLVGIALARRERFGKAQLAGMLLILGFTFFYSFTGGTRNLFAAHLVTFVIGYAFAAPPHRRRQVVIISIIGAAALLAATVLMLRFRNVGFTNWLQNREERPRDIIEDSMFVDYNLFAIGVLVEVFPKRVPYLGWEVPYLALIRPIPRAVWPEKPEGLTSSIEDALGVEGLTIAASFAGEAYISGGWFGVFFAGLFFGALTGWWSHLASPRNSELGILIYASGFFAAVISMRSLFVFTTALLPTVAALIIGTFVVRHLAARAKRWLTRATRLARPLPAGAGRAKR